MTSASPEESAEATAGEGIQQIPIVMSVTELPAVADARDALLRAISQEAQNATDKFPGQASKALEELARAYALVTTDTTSVAGTTPPIQSRMDDARSSVHITANIPTQQFHVQPSNPDFGKDEVLSYNTVSGTLSEG
ncbi:hypothetical protein AB0451_33425 [Streptomyces sp. NPDC052000]|uniref:hypothetical protein n=1 Tax=Streptomyces sp. NPDC052000 TaxID=3155676 RepID=UPI00344D7254